MEFHASQANVLTQKTSCAVVAVFNGGKLSAAAQALDEASQGVIRKLFKNGDLKGDVGECLVLHHLSGCQAERVLVVGFGKDEGCKPGDFRRAADSAAKAVTATGSKDVHVFCSDVSVA